jgi:hypothetical protein
MIPSMRAKDFTTGLLDHRARRRKQKEIPYSGYYEFDKEGLKKPISRMSAFQTDMRRLGLLLLPTFLHRLLTAAFVQAMFSPLHVLPTAFMDDPLPFAAQRAGNYLRKAINNAFDRVTGFEIVDVEAMEVYPQWLMTYDETPDLQDGSYLVQGRIRYGSDGGSKTVTRSANQMPTHTHAPV